MFHGVNNCPGRQVGVEVVAGYWVVALGWLAGSCGGAVSPG